MYCLDNPDVATEVVNLCGLQPVQGWKRPVLVLWPSCPALLSALLLRGCVVTVLVAGVEEWRQLTRDPAWSEATRSGRLRFVCGEADSYADSVGLQSFVAIFTTKLRELQHLRVRHLLTWNGRFCFVGEDDDSSALCSMDSRLLSITAQPLQTDPNVVLTCVEKPIGWMLMSYPRCGTHMLVSALSRHFELQAHGEVFNPSTPAGSHKMETVQQVLEMRWGCRYDGIAVHSSIDRLGHSLNMLDSMHGYSGFWQTIPDYTPTILLTRRNLLARYVSHKVALQTGLWNSTEVEKTGTAFSSVYVSLEDFQQDMKYVQDCWDHAALKFKYTVSITYEDMVRDFEAVSRKVQEFLQVPYEDVSPATVKLTVGLEEIIENYTQVRAWCRRTGHAHFLEEVH